MKYSFDDASLIKEIEIYRASDVGGLDATIVVPEGADAQKIAQFKQEMAQHHNITLLAGEQEGKAVLRVSDVDSASALLTLLTEKGVVSGTARTQETERDAPHKREGDMAKLALFGAGASFTVASSAILAAGVMRENAGETWQGVMGIVPALGLMWSSQQTAEDQMAYLYRDLRDFAEENNLHIGTDVRDVLAAREAPKDLFHAVQQFVYDKGPVFNNWVKAMAVAAGTQGAVKQGNIWKAGGNALMIGGMVIGATLPEKHDAPHADNAGGEISEPPVPPKGFMGEAIDGMVAHPQRIAGGFALIQQALKFAGNKLHDEKKKHDFADAYPDLKKEYSDGYFEQIKKAAGFDKESDDYKIHADKAFEFGHELEKLEKQNLKNERYAKAVLADRISMAGYIVGYSLYTMTNKHNGAKLELEPVIELCANIAHNHPPEQQQAITERLSTFLANHPYSSLSIDEAVEKMNYKLDVLNRAEWLSKAANNAVSFARKQSADIYPPSTVIATEQQSIEKMKEVQALAQVY